MKALSPTWRLSLFTAGASALLLVSSVAANAQQTVVDYTFDDGTGAPASTAANVSASDFARNNADDDFYDYTSGNPPPDANSGDWTTAGTLDPDLYYTFTVTPGTGGASWNSLAFDLADFDAAGIDDGPTAFAVRSSVDGFTADLLSGDVGVTFTTDTVPLDVTATAPVEYRIYGYAAGSTEGLLQVDNVVLANAVPEPAAATALLAAAAFLGGCLLRRRTPSRV